MGLIHDKTILAIVQYSLLFGSCYAAPAAGTNPSQASILSQQSYNLCLYKSSLGLEHEPCTSFGVSGLPPITTVIKSPESTATFVASFLTEYAALISPILIDTVIDGTSTQVYVGELGQVWAKLGDVNVPYPTELPESPIANEKELKRAVKTTKKTTAIQQPTTKAPTPTTTAQAPPPITTKTPPQTTTSKMSTSTTSKSSTVVVPPSSTSTSSVLTTISTTKSSLSSSQTLSSSSVAPVSSVLPVSSISTTKSVVSGSITGSIGSVSSSVSSTLSGLSSTSTCIASTYVSAGATYTAKCTGAQISSSSVCTPSTHVTSGTTMTASCKPTISVCSASTYVTSGSTITAGCTSVCTASTKIVSGKTTVASCSQTSVRVASWTTNKVEQSGVTATAFNSAKASSVASGIEALLSQWNNMGDNSTETSAITSGSTSKKTPASLTTFTTSKVPLATGAAIKRRGLYF